MAKHWGARHMAWVRSFTRRRKRNPSRRRGRRNAYPVAGLVVNRHKRRGHKRHYSSNPKIFGFQLPNITDAIYGAVGFVGTLIAEGFVTPMLPASITMTTLGKYGVRVGLVIAETYLAKLLLGNRAAAIVAIGGGSYVLVTAVKEFAPGVIPGLGTYAQAPRSMGNFPIGGQTVQAYPATRGRNFTTLGRLNGGMAAPPFGAQNSPFSAPRGGANIIPARFRRFQ